jgi:hypothetical protein
MRRLTNLFGHATRNGGIYVTSGEIGFLISSGCERTDRAPRCPSAVSTQALHNSIHGAGQPGYSMTAGSIEMGMWHAGQPHGFRNEKIAAWRFYDF